MNEVERRIYEYCRNVAHGRQTNFSRITASPEALAEFIAKSINDTIKLTNGNRKYTELVVQKEYWLEWLKQESDTE